MTLKETECSIIMLKPHDLEFVLALAKYWIVEIAEMVYPIKLHHSEISNISIANWWIFLIFDLITVTFKKLRSVLLVGQTYARQMYPKILKVT